MTRLTTINEHAHGDDSAASPQDAPAHSYGATSFLPLGCGAADCRTGGREAADPLRSSPSPLEDADRSCTGWFELELPRPPSVNRIDKRFGNKSPEVVEWHKECDYLLIKRRPWPRLKGPFQICIWWDIDLFGRPKQPDIDNPVKPLLDWLQRVEIIENDRWCRRLVVEFGPASLGCRIALRQWMSGGAAGMAA